ncbi:MAG: hypothetical protein HC800_07470 [Phormidesmis sp. RL_2_1]|nr:hypothetical protein [Phormidesmis sp. RL_2_1]
MEQQSPNSHASNPASTSPALPDWVRLQKALSIESERGFNNIEGHQQRFSEFVSSSLLDGLKVLADHFPSSLKEVNKWQVLAQQFDQYSSLSFPSVST